MRVGGPGGRWIGLDDPAWAAFLALVPHDVFHLPAFVRVMAAREPGVRPGALLVECAAGSLLAPLLLRSLDDVPGAPAGAWDAVSPRVFAGPLIRPARGLTVEQVAPACAAAFRDALREAGIVAAFVRQHPLLSLPTPVLRAGEAVIESDSSVALDLGLGRDALRARFRPNHRRDLDGAARAGYRARMDVHWERLDDAAAAYAATMDRLDAASHFRFDREFFVALRDGLPEQAALCVVERGDELACAVVVSLEDGILEYLYAATPDAHVRASPSKLAIDFLVSWGIEHGARWFELGGTRATQGLARFKAGFSGVPAPVLIWQLVADPGAYARLCVAAGVDGATPGAWFPAYRRPR